MAEVAGIVIVALAVSYPLYKFLRKTIKKCKCCQVEEVEETVAVQNVAAPQIYREFSPGLNNQITQLKVQ